MLGLEFGNRAVFVAVGHDPVFVLVPQHELDLNAIALGLGQRVPELLRLFGAHFGESGTQVEVFAGLQRVGAVAREAAVLRMPARKVGH